MANNTEDPAATYDAAFYQAQVEGSLRSAKLVVPEILNLVPNIQSVIDVGCGTGAWLCVFEDCGVKDVLGIDGGSVPPEQLLIAPEKHIFRPLTEPFTPDKRYDLAITLEVAEHLEEEHAEAFVAQLCRASDVIVFGAAIPGQGGHRHVNERWPSYWNDLFECQGYTAFDLIRPIIWADDRIEWWYRQNTLLFVHENRDDLIAHYAKMAGIGRHSLDIVHPDCFLMYRNIQEKPFDDEDADTREWIRSRINEDHRQLCEIWLKDLKRQNVENIALFGAGGTAGLGPYLIYRCDDLDIRIEGYCDFFPDRMADQIAGVSMFEVAELPHLTSAIDAVFVASPGYASEIIAAIEEAAPELSVPVLGSIPKR